MNVTDTGLIGAVALVVGGLLLILAMDAYWKMLRDEQQAKPFTCHGETKRRLDEAHRRIDSLLIQIDELKSGGAA